MNILIRIEVSALEKDKLEGHAQPLEIVMGLEVLKKLSLGYIPEDIKRMAIEAADKFHVRNLGAASK